MMLEVNILVCLSLSAIYCGSAKLWFLEAESKCIYCWRHPADLLFGKIKMQENFSSGVLHSGSLDWCSQLCLQWSRSRWLRTPGALFCNLSVLKSPSGSVTESAFLQLLVDQNYSLKKMHFSFSSIDHALMNFFQKTNSLGMDTLDVWFYGRKVIYFLVIENPTYNKCICTSFTSLQRVWNSFSQKNNDIAVRYGKAKKAHFSFFPNVFLQRHTLTNRHTYKGQS